MKTKHERIRRYGTCGLVVGVVLVSLLTGVFAQEEQEQVLAAGPKVTINVDGMDIVQVLNAFSQQSGQSIVVGPEVKGAVTARLKDVPWEEALEVIIEPYGYTYKRTGSTVVIMTRKDEPTQRSLKTQVFEMSYLDVSDIIPAIENHLSPLGKVSVLGTQAERGWAFDTGSTGRRGGSASSMDKRKRDAGRDERTDFSKILVVTDIPTVLEKVAYLLERLDVLPQQVLIEARFLEVDIGLLNDIGVEFGTGEGGASGNLQSVLTSKGGEILGIGAQSVSGGATPVAFEAQGSGVNATAPFNTGLSMAFQKLSGTEFQVLLHALEEDANAKTLSAPRILAVNNQEAAIIVGTKFPIIQSDTVGDSASTSTSLEYYENIGIQLNVVPQVCADSYIRMLVHPAVTDQTGTASAKTTSGTGVGTPLTEYPILSTREADTQVMIKSGETIVIGGLLADRKVKSEFKVPILGSIPLLGVLFRRTTMIDQNVELLIFITASIKHPQESGREGAQAMRRSEFSDVLENVEDLDKEDIPEISESE
jgi:type IV pilus assembly protein PilQ